MAHFLSSFAKTSSVICLGCLETVTRQSHAVNGCHKTMHQDDNYAQQLASSELSEQEVEQLRQVLDRAKVSIASSEVVDNGHLRVLSFVPSF